MTIAEVIAWKYPTAQFRLQGIRVDPHTAPNGEACTGLSWESSEIPRPTDADIAQWTSEYAAIEPDEKARQGYRADLMALAAALFKASTGKFPTAAQAAQIKADFVTARKALS